MIGSLYGGEEDPVETSPSSRDDDDGDRLIDLKATGITNIKTVEKYTRYRHYIGTLDQMTQKQKAQLPLIQGVALLF